MGRDKETERDEADMKNSGEIINLCGKTGMGEWVSLIAGACLLAAGDTGAVHIAAASNVPSVCVLGGMDKDLIYPYKIDIMEQGQACPQIVQAEEKECFGCRRRREEGYGAENDMCKKGISDGEPMQCLKEIAAEDVYVAIKEILWNDR